MKNRSSIPKTHRAQGGRTQYGPNDNPRIWKEEPSTAPQTRGEATDSMHVIPDMRGLLIAELKVLYGAEQAMVAALPAIIKGVSSEALASIIGGQMEAAQRHVTHLEAVFSAVRAQPGAERSKGVEGIVKEGEELLGKTEKGPTRDAAIILLMQKFEHYGIAAYGSLCAIAEALGETRAARLLEEAIIEERKADERLSDLARDFINVDAA
jgi:ferritin-like metal-binding protein YciE